MIYEYIIILILTIQIDISIGKEESLTTSKFKNYMVTSFGTFTNGISNFFSTTFNKIDRRREQINNAFYNFFDKSFGSSKKSVCNTTELKEEMSESGMSTPELIAYHGYRSETHIVVTLDGYILTIHRVLQESQEQSQNQTKLVLLHHGLLGSSEDWILMGPGKSLPYILCDAYIDVWLVNSRGNKYSRSHISKATNSSDFWDFSWHEIGAYDLPAVIEYVKEFTESKLDIHFIGHSMGGTALLVCLSKFPKFNYVLKSAMLLAPLVFMNEIKGPLKMLAELHSTEDYYVISLLEKYEFDKTHEFPIEISQTFCKDLQKNCANPLLLLANSGENFIDTNILDSVLSHVPAGGSTKTISHYEQLVESGEFQMFDYGTKINLKKYNVASPPKYNLKYIKIPIFLFTSKDDRLSTKSNILTLLSEQPNVLVHYIVKKNGFSHTDFVWSTYATELIYYIILDILEQNYLGNEKKIQFQVIN